MAAAPDTLGFMKERIASEIVRSNLTTQIANAITDAIKAYQNERFRFSDITPNAPPTFNTVAARYIYTAADNANIGSALKFDYVLALIGNMYMPLNRKTPEEIKLYNAVNTMSGQPWAYAYEGNQIMFAPIPSGVYAITLGLFRLVAAPADDGEADNPWMTDAEVMIRSRAKYELATHVTRNAAMAKAMSPLPPSNNGGVAGAAWVSYCSLKGEANRITGRGKIKPMAF